MVLVNPINSTHDFRMRGRIHSVYVWHHTQHFRTRNKWLWSRLLSLFSCQDHWVAIKTVDVVVVPPGLLGIHAQSFAVHEVIQNSWGWEGKQRWCKRRWGRGETKRTVQYGDRTRRERPIELYAVHIYIYMGQQSSERWGGLRGSVITGSVWGVCLGLWRWWSCQSHRWNIRHGGRGSF